MNEQQRKAMELALEALDLMVLPRGFQAQVRCEEAYEAIKEALAQPEQEPDATTDDFELLPVDPTPEMKSAAIEVELFDHDTGKNYVLSWEEAEQIYSAMLNAAPTPPQRTWVGLTNEERVEVADISDCFEDVVDAVEAKLREKNT